MVELALIVPFAFLLIVIIMNFSGVINAWMSVSNAARAAGDYAILSGSSAGLPTTATSASLKSLINADLAALPNLGASNPAACIRKNNNGTPTTILETPSGACSDVKLPALPGDGEFIAAGSTVTYANITVDITYTYTPFFLGTRIFGYALPGVPTRVHQRSVMRIL
jgi:hypothetical protein